MKQFMTAVKKFVEDEEGVTAIEYGLIAALIAVGISVALIAVRTGLSTLFNNIATCVTTPGTCTIA